ncbi:MAG: hypothetical protein CR989_04300 [Flavobacteriales bacterium]|nr:MAG: hypothetical protein CR989_04300 [Flavobacteriales bacterium]
MKKIGAFIFILFLMNTCINNDVAENHNCDYKTIISLAQYQNAPSDNLTINSLKIENECLIINFSSSGCDGQSWEVNLIDSGNVYNDNPLQRNLRLSLKNKELCEAYITKELSFDISNLKVEGHKIQLNLINSGKSLLFEY